MADHVHELIESERPLDEGQWYCWICDTDFDDIPPEDEVTLK